MLNSSNVLRLALTPGEPAGIGPDIVLSLLQQAHPCQLIVIADPQLMRARAEKLGLQITITHWHENYPLCPQQAGELLILPVSLATTARCGQLNAQNAHYVLNTLKQAAAGCLNGTFQGLVTGPVHKGIINEGGIAFSGHTEFLAEYAEQHTKKSCPVVMMLATPGLRVALATTHCPLTEIVHQLTAEKLETTLRILHHSLTDWLNTPEPRILVCGLNPHAGEDGHLGTEEITLISPVIENLKDEYPGIRGPFSADTLFTPEKLQHADAILSMYHDQGLPVLKSRGFGQAVNITLGLPFLRVSVDHGTALALAGTQQSDTGSLNYALKTAIEILSS
jgi:4-hydroxythreonine-4-phosphate dehydrogenase